jgi:hypothetical protein
MENNSNDTMGKGALWIGGGCLAVFICVVLACVAGISGIVWLTQTPENVDISIDAPSQVKVGDEIKFTVTIKNNRADSIELSGIDVGMNYLNGALIESVEPSYESINQYDGFGDGEKYQSYYFHTTIASGSAVSIVFIGTAIAPGDFNGSLDVCINSDYSCFKNVIRTIVK